MKKRTVGVLLAAFFAMALTGCGDKQPQPGEVKGYDKGEEYLSIWVHSIEDTEEGQCYRKSVDAFNKKYDGKYFADIELSIISATAVSILYPIALNVSIIEAAHGIAFAVLRLS